MASIVDIYVGQRRSYAEALCTVRYYGPLSNTKGEWLGVEWDDPSRGKHSGQHEGQQIFQCLSSSPTAASFVRPSRKQDPERTLLEAIRFKYAPKTASVDRAGNPAISDTAIEISGKVVEEVGFERIQKQLSVLTDLKIVLVDELVVSGVDSRHNKREAIREAQLQLEETCPNIVELDVGWNPIETWQDVADACVPFKKLKILKSSGLRLRDYATDLLGGGDEGPFRQVEELQLNECLITLPQVIEILFPRGKYGFPSLSTLTLSSNELDSLNADPTIQGLQCPSVTTLVLENNKFADLSFLPTLFSLFPMVATLSLQGNAISDLGLDASGSVSFPTLATLNLAGNAIPNYTFVNALPRVFPNLSSLRISRNPLYEQAEPSDASTAQPSDLHRQQARTTTSDSTGYYLTLARVPRLKSLNYTTITPRDREEGEIYYLSVVEKELKTLLENETPNGGGDTDAASSPSPRPEPQRPSREERISLARQRHPLYSSLCTKYDRQDVLERYARVRHDRHDPSAPSNLRTYAPGTLGARLVEAEFYIPSTSTRPPPPAAFKRSLPTTISVYRLKSLVGRHFGLRPLRFRLVYESHEYDPVVPISSSRNTADTGPEAWARWGDWDVDNNNDGDEAGPGGGEKEPLEEEGQGEAHDAPPPAASPKYITRAGQRFKKRETEILDGMRAWGDFLDLDAALVATVKDDDDDDDGGLSRPSSGSGRTSARDVRVRVEVDADAKADAVMC